MRQLTHTPHEKDIDQETQRLNFLFVENCAIHNLGDRDAKVKPKNAGQKNTNDAGWGDGVTNSMCTLVRTCCPIWTGWW